MDQCLNQCSRIARFQPPAKLVVECPFPDHSIEISPCKCVEELKDPFFELAQPCLISSSFAGLTGFANCGSCESRMVLESGEDPDIPSAFFSELLR